MKILLIGIDFFDYSLSLQEAFERLGHTVICYNIKQSWGVLGKVHREMYSLYQKKIKHSNQLYRLPLLLRKIRSREVLRIANEYLPDALVAFPGYGLTSKDLSKMKVPHKVIWLYDSINRLPEMTVSLEEYDKVFTFEGSDINRIKNMGKESFFLPLCVDDRKYYPLEEKIKKDIDILFIGNLSESRVEALLEIREHFPNAKMVIYGKYSKTLEQSPRFKDRLIKNKDIFMKQLVSFHEARELYTRSKICINLHHAQSQYGANMRLYEICATKGFQIVDSNPYIEENFQGCMVITKSIQEMITAISYYLIHEDEVNMIAQNGYNKVMKSELFLHRAKRIVDSISD